MEKRLKKSLLSNFVLVSLLSVSIVQSCSFNQLIPATNQPEFVKSNIDSLKAIPSVMPVEKVNLDKLATPEPKPSFSSDSVISKINNEPLSTTIPSTSASALPIIPILPVEKVDSFSPAIPIPTPIVPIPTPIKTPDLPTNYPQTFIPSAPINKGNVTTFAGSGVAGYLDGTGANAQFNYPPNVAVDNFGNVFVADLGNNRIRKITSTGVVTTIAGSGVAGYLDGTGTNAQFNWPCGIAVDNSGNIYIADYNNHRIRKITSTGVVTTIAGSGVAGYLDETGTNAKFNYPISLSVDNSGNIYIADYNNHRIRKITSTGIVTTFAGSGVAGYLDGIGSNAKFISPIGIAVDNVGNVFVADTGNNVIRKITSTGIVTTFAGSGVAGYLDGTGTNAQFNYPEGVSVDNNGNVFVTDTINNRIRKITSTGVVTTIAGSGTYGYVDGISTVAQFTEPQGLAVDKKSGVIYVADNDVNNVIRKIQ